MENNSSSSSFKTDNDGVGSSSTGVSLSEEVEGMQDDDSSSQHHPAVETEGDIVDNFQWQRVIEVSPLREHPFNGDKGRELSIAQHDNLTNKSTESMQKIEEQAQYFFFCGVQAEKAGLLGKATSFYRKAVQLVPDIESHIAENFNEDEDSFSEDSDDSSSKESLPREGNEDIEIGNLVERFQRIATNIGTTSICQPKRVQQASHISILPPEIFIYILKWVVSSDLDLLSLEQVSKVCRGFYLCARDAEIWKLACVRIWAANTDTPSRYISWRNMFIQRPHLSFNGAYISKTTYVRYGEPSFQDLNYRPCYLVEYFRYLRFFPEGLVLMLTTPDDPYQSLFKLRHRRSRYQNIMYGRYKFAGSTVMAVVKKPKGETITPGGLNFYRYRRQRQINLQEACDQTFHLELELRSVKDRYNCQLAWNGYSIHMKYRNDQETVTDFDLNPSNFPPFWYSRVKSYNAETESPLK